MGWPEYEKDLINESVDPDYILDKYFHTGPSHVFQGAVPGEEAGLKERVAEALYEGFSIRVHTIQLVVCGSAHLGFSPVPFKLATPFNHKRSDIDIAVVSPELFEAWWTELQALDLDPDIRDVVSTNLFLGFIDPATVKDSSKYGAVWWKLFGKMKTDRASGVRGRLYKNFWSMQRYHRIAVVGGRRPRGTLQNRPFRDGPKPAIPVAAETGDVYFVISS